MRIAMGMIFVYASIDKIIHPAAFAQAVFNYQILPDHLINITAIILPCLELCTGICLIIGKWIPGSLFVINFLLLIFLCALVFNLARGLNIHCGCFGTSVQTLEGSSMVGTVARDCIFFAAAVFLLFNCCSEHHKDLRADR
jgi:uncharacterized membrane protein YphA (DoxX/SURF4 family)